MPFTVSHAVVALPFSRTLLPAGAVALGSITPDLPLFLPVGVTYGQTHGFPELFYTSLPLAFLLMVLWRLLVRGALRDLVPLGIAERLPLSWSSTVRAGWVSLWKEGLWVFLALLIGVLSHVLWDGFTHENRFGTRIFPALSADWALSLPGYHWLQYLSSLLGFAVVVMWLTLWLTRREPVKNSEAPHPVLLLIKRFYGAGLALLFPGFLLVRVLSSEFPENVGQLITFTVKTGTQTVGLAVLATIIASVCVLGVRLRTKKGI